MEEKFCEFVIKITQRNFTIYANSIIIILHLRKNKIDKSVNVNKTQEIQKSLQAISSYTPSIKILLTKINK